MDCKVNKTTGELHIFGSLAEYGGRDAAIGLFVDKNSLRDRIDRDNKIREHYEATGEISYFP